MEVCSEADAIGWEDWGDDDDDDDDGYDENGVDISLSNRSDHVHAMQKLRRAKETTSLAAIAKKATLLYGETKKASVGDSVKCAGCGGHFVKTTYNKTFCSNGRTVKGKSSCKDKYHNLIACLRNSQS